MSSIFFRIEVYGVDNFGCQEMDLMGYDNIDKLLSDCWYIIKIYAQKKCKNCNKIQYKHEERRLCKSANGFLTGESFDDNSEESKQ